MVIFENAEKYTAETKAMEKSITLKNGVALSYYEFGAGNKDVMIISQLYFITYRAWLEAMADRFHIYAIAMRMDDAHGPISEYWDDGAIYWPAQWAEDINGFAEEKGIEHYIYCGKCHGTTPSWVLLKRYPEKLKAVITMSLMPFNRDGIIPLPRKAFVNMIMGYPDKTLPKPDPTCRHPECNYSLKECEMATVDYSAFQKISSHPSFFPLAEYKTREEVLAFMDTVKTPILFYYGSKDHMYEDWAIEAAMHAENGKIVIVNGERHLCELDIPERMALDCIAFIDQLAVDAD